MRRLPILVTVVLLGQSLAYAHGILIPDDPQLPPLAMLNHKVEVAIDDPVAVTRVEQTFRNHTDRRLEATYIFPVPAGATVKEFSLWVNGKEVKGELVEASKARATYTEAIRRSQEPALLECLGHDLFKLRVANLAAKSDQKVSLRYTSVVRRQADAVEYIYPLKTGGRAAATLREFSVKATIKAAEPIQNVYSPTHALEVKRIADREVAISFARNQAVLDRDFQLFYSLGAKDVGLTALTHRPAKDENGHFLLLVTPKVELPKEYNVPRDVVLVLDTSSSMRGVKLQQAKNALKFCLGQLGAKDRFGLVNFSTKVGHYKMGLTESTPEAIADGKKWVDNLQAIPGTNINDGLLAALDLRTADPGRTFTLIFFTDGQPSVSERNPENILKNVAAKNTASTRIFTFGVGDDVNASFLDRLAQQTRAVSTYVRPQEDIETKVSGLYAQISHPVLADLQLAVGPEVTLEEVYPPHLPDLFKNGQLLVMGRYRGHGKAEIKLTGKCGKDAKEFTYRVDFPEKTDGSREFVEELWARRKVGFLLDQIRVNGNKKELVDEVIALAKKYGITTPYTSYLIVTDSPFSGAGKGFGMYGAVPHALAPKAPGMAAQKVTDFLRQAQGKPAPLAAQRGAYEDGRLANPAAEKDEAAGRVLADAKARKEANDRAAEALQKNEQQRVQNGPIGVQLSLQSNALRNQAQLARTAVRRAGNRNCLEIGGVWIDEAYTAKTPTVAVKAMSDAYFRILERHPEVKSVFRLGNHLVWITPSGTALVIDTNDGKDKLTDAEIDKLFVAKK